MSRLPSDSSENSPRRWSRQKRLGIGLAAIGVIGGGGAVGTILATRNGTQPAHTTPQDTLAEDDKRFFDDLKNVMNSRFIKNQYTERGDTGRWVDQEEINAQYRTLFKTLQKAQKEAEAEGKKLAVLVGEFHGNMDSKLVNCMTLLACHELSINTALWETRDFNNKQDGVPELIAAYKKAVSKKADTRKEFRMIDDAQYLSGILDANNGNGNIIDEKEKIKALTSAIEKDGLKAIETLDVVRYRERIFEFLGDQSLTHCMLAAEYLGMKNIAADPLQTSYPHDFVKDKKENTSPEGIIRREKGMLPVMEKQSQSFIYINGAAHTSTLAEKLDPKKFKTVVIDGDNTDTKPLEIDPSDTPQNQEEKRQDRAFVDLRIAELQTKGDLHVVINGREIASPGEAFLRAMVAAATHVHEQTPKGGRLTVLDMFNSTVRSRLEPFEKIRRGFEEHTAPPERER